MKLSQPAILGYLALSCQTALAVNQNNIETISVLGARTGINQQQLSGAVTVISQQQIEQSGAVDIVDLLRGQPSMAFSQSGGKGALAELRLRGAEANQVLVLIDGVPINDVSQGGTVDFSQIQLGDVTRIEILRGPQSSLWGSGAVAGVISIHTINGQTERGQLGMQAGNHNSRNVHAGYSGRYNNLSYTVSGAFDDTDGTNIALQGNENDGYRSWHLANRLGWHLSDQDQLNWSFQVNRNRADFDGTDYVTTGLPIDANNFTRSLRQSGQLYWQHQSKGSPWQYRAGIAFNNNNNDSFTDHINAGSNNGDLQRLYWQASWQYQRHSNLTLVAEHSREHFEQVGDASPYGDPNQQHTNSINSLVIDAQQQLAPQWHLSASVRFDHNGIFDNSESHRLGLTYNLTAGSKIYVSLGKAVKNPTFIERYGYYATSSSPFVGNPDLQPEFSNSVELGSQWQLPADWQWQLSVYRSELKDEINGFYYDPQQAITTAVNNPTSSHRQGLETTVQGDLGDLNVQLNYSYLDASEPDGSGGQQMELRRPRHTAGITLNLPFAGDRGNLNLHAAYQGSRKDSYYPPYPRPSSIVNLAAYTLVDLTAQWQLSHQWQLQLRAENLFNHRYQDVYGYAGMNRSCYAGVQFHF